VKLVPLAVAVAVCLLGNAALAAKTPPRRAPRTILICHATHVKTRPYVLLRVAVTSVHARLRRGDVMPANGACPQAQTPLTPTTTASTTTATTTSS
jgi:hypothetical protein